MSDAPMQLPPAVEDLELALVHDLALLTAAMDRVITAGYTLTHPHACRRARLTGAREALLAAREAESRLSALTATVATLVRRLDPMSEMLPEGRA